jgi:hypothetical protein
MFVEFIGMRKLEKGLCGSPCAVFTAPVSAVKYDRGTGSSHYYGRRQYIRIGCFSRGELDGKIHRAGDVLVFGSAEVILY